MIPLMFHNEMGVLHWIDSYTGHTFPWFVNLTKLIIFLSRCWQIRISSALQPIALVFWRTCSKLPLMTTHITIYLPAHTRLHYAPAFPLTIDPFVRPCYTSSINPQLHPQHWFPQCMWTLHVSRGLSQGMHDFIQFYQSTHLSPHGDIRPLMFHNERGISHWINICTRHTSPWFVDMKKLLTFLSWQFLPNPAFMPLSTG